MSEEKTPEELDAMLAAIALPGMVSEVEEQLSCLPYIDDPGELEDIIATIEELLVVAQGACRELDAQGFPASGEAAMRLSFSAMDLAAARCGSRN